MSSPTEGLFCNPKIIISFDHNGDLFTKLAIEHTVNVNWFSLSNVDMNLEMVDDVAKRMYPSVFSREINKIDATTRENVALRVAFCISLIALTWQAFRRHP